ncbi:MAG TPA: response regulator transcription factor [Anaerolineales bacterium]|nr:response regulator transcription factor [Anaerolineales bacterium]
MYKVLLVDDDAIIRRMLQKVIQDSGYEVFSASNTDQAVETLAITAMDVVICDIRMPGLSGLDLLKYIREQEKDCEVILITSYASVETAIQALRRGAFDYLTKPVTKEKLLDSLTRATEKLQETRQRAQVINIVQAGLQSMLGSSKQTSSPDSLTAPLPADGPLSVAQSPLVPRGADLVNRYIKGPVVLDLDRFTVQVNEDRIDITPSEFEILHALFRNPDRVITAQELVQALRGYSVENWEAKDVIRPHISNLRRKLIAADPAADIIETIRSIGYIIRTKTPE